MNYKIDKNNNIVLTLNVGEKINASMNKVANIEKIEFGWINGIGAIENPEIGYFDTIKRKYIKKLFKGDFELLSLIGNISIFDKEPFVHTHITFSNTRFQVFGGHLFDAKISAAGEFYISNSNLCVEREYNKSVGLNLLCIKNEKKF